MDVDEIIHRTGLAVGGVVLLLGLVGLFVTGFGTSLPVGLIVAQGAAVFGLVLAVFTIRTRYLATPQQAAVPEVEFPLSTPTPGDDLDEMVYRLTELRESTIEYRDQIREQVGEVAIAVIRQREECSREEAISRLRSGEWTDNSAAASFFVEGGVEQSTSFAEQLQRRLFGGESAFESQLGETVRALEDHAEFLDDVTDTVEPDDRSMDASKIVDPDAGDRVSETTRYTGLFRTRHWTGVTAFALAGVAVGAFSAQPGVLLASAVGLGVAGYSRVTAAPTLANLEVERTLSDHSPEPGDEVDVQLTVENTGESFLTDIRLVDRVPPMMRVVDGSARLGTSLRPGQTAHFEYTVVADRGEHSWPLQVVGRDLSGSREREAFIEPSNDAEMECLPRLKTALETPVRMQTSMYSGQVSTEMGGGGLEFHSIRDYQPGDPMRRINWKQFARTGEFSTIDMREERAAKVVLMFDARESAYVSPGPGERHALDRSIEASYDVFASLLDGGHLVGFAAFDTVPLWMGPNTGDEHTERARRMYVDHPAISPLPPSVLDKTGGYVDPMTHVRRQLPKNTQIFLFSPLTEDYVYEVARRLDGAGHLVTVISPDPTAARTLGQRLARLERKSRIVRLREHGVRVIDWGVDNSLRLELEHATRRW